ncbi:SprT family zinc-dependent metalloprotease [uncultured Erythrobacter sp.]|uniref:M48 family metallopeptidase n=1 Tax=uncultured Erythrobacter sp. TaxID=263913 RepID=UPI00261ED1C3|nr:SprT family zinc-dependent metalloprotease [uncultured Erythrobacter sp.]
MIDWLKRADITKPPNPQIEPEIELNGASIPIALRRHRTAKRLTLRLAPDGSEVRITLPKWANGKDAIAFAHSRADWLAQQLAKVPARSAPGPGGTLQYRGETLAVEWDAAAPRRPKRTGDIVRIGGPQEGLDKRLQRWLEREALALFEDDMADYTAAAALGPVPVGLSRAQRRWGSCSDKDRIRINWRLVQAPDFVRRSVVAHEVAHLIHFDHSPAFHALLGDIYEDDISRADKWLKDKGRSLYASFG